MQPAGPARAVAAIRLALLISLAAALAAFWATHRADPAAGEPSPVFGSASPKPRFVAPDARTTVERYLAARADGDAAAACRELSAGQRFELVARVTGDWKRAPARDCTRHVLRTSERSTAVRPGLRLFTRGKLLARWGNGNAMLVHPANRPDDFLELIFEGGRWRIDGQAAEKGSFVHYHCLEWGYGPASRCGCVYESLRRDGIGLYDGLTPKAEVRRGLARARRACAN